jgi:hypothetical protein
MNHCPRRYRLAKFHIKKQVVKKYLRQKKKYFAAKARAASSPYMATNDVTDVPHQYPGKIAPSIYGNEIIGVPDSDSSDSEVVDVTSDASQTGSLAVDGPSCTESSQVPASPKRFTPIKPLVLSPNTCNKIERSKAAAMARRAAIEAGLKCAICETTLSVQNTEKLCDNCLHLSTDSASNSREVTVTGGVTKTKKKVKKAVASLKIDFQEHAINIKGDGSKKSRIKKTPKVFDV